MSAPYDWERTKAVWRSIPRLLVACALSFVADWAMGLSLWCFRKSQRLAQ